MIVLPLVILAIMNFICYASSCLVHPVILQTSSYNVATRKWCIIVVEIDLPFPTFGKSADNLANPVSHVLCTRTPDASQDPQIHPIWKLYRNC